YLPRAGGSSAEQPAQQAWPLPAAAFVRVAARRAAEMIRRDRRHGAAFLGRQSSVGRGRRRIGEKRDAKRAFGVEPREKALEPILHGRAPGWLARAPVLARGPPGRDRARRAAPASPDSRHRARAPR